MSKHEGVSCDFCSATNFTGRRFKCLVCSDYDLCSNCYDKAEHGHPSHPMQCLLNKKDFTIYFGETFKTKAVSYTCPCCGQMGFNLDALIAHAKSKHSDTHDRVLCPVCVASRHALHSGATQDIISHLQREHSVSNGVRDIVALLEEPTPGGVLLNRRNNLQLRFPDSLMDSTSTFSTGQSFESVRPFNDLLTHISSRCNDIGPIIFPRSVSRSQSRLSQRNRDKSTVSDTPRSNSTPSPPNTNTTKSDYSDRFVSKTLELLPNIELKPSLQADKSQFIQDLLLSSLDPRLTAEIVKETNKEVLKPPEIPKSLESACIHIIKPVEHLPPSVDMDVDKLSSRRKLSNKSIRRRDNNNN